MTIHNLHFDKGIHIAQSFIDDLNKVPGVSVLLTEVVDRETVLKVRVDEIRQPNFEKEFESMFSNWKYEPARVIKTEMSGTDRNFTAFPNLKLPNLSDFSKEISEEVDKEGMGYRVSRIRNILKKHKFYVGKY